MTATVFKEACNHLYVVWFRHNTQKTKNIEVIIFQWLGSVNIAAINTLCWSIFAFYAYKEVIFQLIMHYCIIRAVKQLIFIKQIQFNLNGAFTVYGT